MIFSQFHRHILKYGTMLFPTTFISMSEKIGVGLKKQVAKSDIPVLTFFPAQI